MQDFYHQPVLVEMAVEKLITKTDGIYVDCTAGGGGHAEIILSGIDCSGKLLCIDADPDAVKYLKNRLTAFSNKIVKQNYFDKLQIMLIEENLLPVSGILFDLGLSSHQVDRHTKGFSFRSNGPLDMRFHPDQKTSAVEVVNTYALEKLQEILRFYGEERHWRKIAEKIVKYRSHSTIKTTGELTKIVKSVVHDKNVNKSLARVFQAIRIEVNDELIRLKRALEQAFESLERCGRIVAISYHSLEDRIIKEFFRYKALECICPPDFPTCVCQKKSEMKTINRKPIRPSLEEVNQNPRARSAKLRVAEKTVDYQDILK
jgi:16S rRNA (cytosine1402-N4)-methyltransferase